MVEWGGHHGDWGGFGPPSYIVKKCPEYLCQLVPQGYQIPDYPIPFCVLKLLEFQQDSLALSLLLIGLCELMCIYTYIYIVNNCARLADHLPINEESKFSSSYFWVYFRYNIMLSVPSILYLAFLYPITKVPI